MKKISNKSILMFPFLGSHSIPDLNFHIHDAFCCPRHKQTSPYCDHSHGSLCHESRSCVDMCFTIQIVSAFKYLGVIIDDMLTSAMVYLIKDFNITWFVGVVPTIVQLWASESRKKVLEDKSIVMVDFLFHSLSLKI